MSVKEAHVGCQHRCGLQRLQWDLQRHLGKISVDVCECRDLPVRVWCQIHCTVKPKPVRHRFSDSGENYGL